MAPDQLPEPVWVINLHILCQKYIRDSIPFYRAIQLAEPGSRDYCSILSQHFSGGRAQCYHILKLIFAYLQIKIAYSQQIIPEYAPVHPDRASAWIRKVPRQESASIHAAF